MGLGNLGFPMRRHYQATYPIVKTIVKKDMAAHRSMSWKIAYGDLMTAMMAFFLLLWLYSSLPHKKKTEIAHYFTPTAGVVGASGIGTDGGKDANMAEGAGLAYNKNDGITRNQLQQGPLPEAPKDTVIKDDAAEASSIGVASTASNEEIITFDRAFMALQNQFQQLVQRTENNLFKNNLIINNVQQDIHVSLVNTAQNPMFDDEAGELSTAGIQAMDAIASIAVRTQSKLIVTGYTTTPAFATNNEERWEQAVRHANLVVRFMMDRKLAGHCIERVTGKSETLPMGSEREPEDRVIITLMRDACGKE